MQKNVYFVDLDTAGKPEQISRSVLSKKEQEVLNKTSPTSFTHTKPEQKKEAAIWAANFRIVFRAARKAFFSHYICRTKNAQQWVNFFSFCCREYNDGKDIYNPALYHFQTPSDIITKVSEFENPPELYELKPPDGFSEIPHHDFEDGFVNPYQLHDLVPFDHHNDVDMLDKHNQKFRLDPKTSIQRQACN